MGSPKRKHALPSLIASGALAASGLVGLSLATAPAAVATTPCGASSPTLTKLTLTPGSVNVKSKAKTIKVAGTTSGTPVTSVSMTARAVGSTKKTAWGSFKVASGGHSFSGSVTIPKFTSKGTWHVDYLYLGTDVGGQYYDYSTLVGMANVKSTFTVASNPDAKKPTISSIALSKTSVNTKSKVAKVAFTAKAHDTGGAGVSGVYVSLQSGSKSLYGYATPKKGKIAGTITVPKWIGTKSYKVSYLSVYDKVGNATSYSAAGGSGYKKLPAKFKKTLKVTSKTDSKKPTIGATSVSPGNVTVGSVAPVKVNVSVKASDSQSGVSWVSVELHGQTISWATQYGSLSPKAGGVWKGTVSLGCYTSADTYDVVVTVTDRAGNQTQATKGTVNISAAP